MQSVMQIMDKHELHADTKPFLILFLCYGVIIIWILSIKQYT